jgi:GT2 family glycosyltransferase
VKGRTVAFWAPAAALVYAQAGYPLALAALAALARLRAPGTPPPPPAPAAGELPDVALVVAAHAEEDVIAAKVANARALDWPADRLTVVVACDGSPDATPRRAREAGADLVLELPWGGKVRAQDAAVDATDAPLLAFSDANALWEPGALRALVAALEQDGVGYACGSVSFAAHPSGHRQDGTNQEGLYWRYEMGIRARESALASVTGGNGAIYAVRRPAYARVDPVMGHDLSFPFTLVRRGWRAVYAPAARATEKMVPTVEGEWRRKRRMMSHAWPIVLRGGLLDLRGLPPRYAWMVVSHRWLRYAAPFLHLVLLAATPAATRTRPRRAARVAAVGQAAVLAAAAAGGRAGRPGLIARYYVLTQASIAAGLWDHLRHGTPAGWAPPEGTR